MPERKYRRKVYKKGKKGVKIFFQVLAIITSAFLLLGFILFLYFVKDLPRPERFSEGLIPQSTKIYDGSGEILLYEIAGEEKRTLVSFEEIPEHLKWAVIAAEDKNFYEHRGIDLEAIFRAVLYDLQIGKPLHGGSTITQQLIRSYFLTRKKTLERKTREIILTLELERRYPKEQILEWYLNLIPFGSNLYGVEAASQAFFRKSVSEVSLAESAVLAAIIRRPSALFPYGTNFQERRQELLNLKNYVLRRMKELGYISENQLKETLQEEIEFAEVLHPIRAPHFVIYVRSYLEAKYGKEYLERAGLKVYTTLDYDLQLLAEKIIKEKIEGFKTYNAHNAGLVSLSPASGEILAMVGSKNWFGESEGCSEETGRCKFDPKVNVTLTSRQPGSAFKPFAYAQALEKGFLPETMVWDVFTEFNPSCSPRANQATDLFGTPCYHPKNYDGRFSGQITLRNALAQSRNVPSVKVLYLAGLKNTLDLAKKFGLTTLTNGEKYGLSLVLGGGEVRLLEMASAYGVFATEGVKTPLNFIKKIEDGKGDVLEEMKTAKIRILSQQTARQINDILSDNQARAPMFGWRSPMYIEGYQVAAKTGTTQDYNDAWAIGYTPSLVTGVWVGNNDNSPMAKPGVSLAGPIWQNFMLYALQKFEKRDFQKPEKISPSNPALEGFLPGPHPILHFINKNNPQEEGDSQNDMQYKNWEWAVQNWLSAPLF